MVYPIVTAGIMNRLDGSILNDATLAAPDTCSALKLIPKTTFWVWWNLLVLCVGNQRLPDGVQEDSLNKPWRPIAAGRISSSGATRLWYGLQIAVLGVSSMLGATVPTAVILLLSWLYNDQEGGGNAIIRNLLNGLAIVCWILGATMVAYDGSPFHLAHRAFSWLCTIGTIVMTTLQLQDLRDQEVDKKRDRSTVPLLIGDKAAR